MEVLQIPENNHTPRILLDPFNGIFEFQGISLPEDLFAFYMPVLQWLDDYLAAIRKIENQLTLPSPKVSFKMTYYNSGSVRMLIHILQKLKMISDIQSEMVIDWYYEKEDEHILDNGKDLAELTGVTFRFKVLKD
jgi:hypothetical protein